MLLRRSARSPLPGDFAASPGSGRWLGERVDPTSLSGDAITCLCRCSFGVSCSWVLSAASFLADCRRAGLEFALEELEWQAPVLLDSLKKCGWRENVALKLVSQPLRLFGYLGIRRFLKHLCCEDPAAADE
ncbi:hypothetical protein QQ045_005763 [Rhodiola kirilowii]